MFIIKIHYWFFRLLRKLGLSTVDVNNHLIKNMRKRLETLNEGTVKFKIEFDKDGSWVAESVNLDGIATGGQDSRQIESLIKDAIFTYFDIPPRLCDDNLLHLFNDLSNDAVKFQVTKTQKVGVN